MGTADRPRSAARPFAIAFTVAAVAAIGGTAVLQAHGREAPEEPTPVDVEATSVFQFATLDEMVAASDAVVVGEVVATERGRLVGDPASGGVVSRVVTVEVRSVELDRDGAVGPTVLVEEEGWLPDGAPVIVDGVRPSRAGDVGLWFLDRLDVGEVPTYLVINSQGRYVHLPDGSVQGGDQGDPLVRELQATAWDDLIAAAGSAGRAGSHDVAGR